MDRLRVPLGSPAQEGAAQSGEEIVSTALLVTERYRGCSGPGRALDWRLAATLDDRGSGDHPSAPWARGCAATAGLYSSDEPFRSRVVMARHGYGRGEYRYFSYPLPPVIAELRIALYPPLADANRWNAALGIDVRFPADHAAFLARCHEAGQSRPTPLVLQYGPDDFNCSIKMCTANTSFPLQVTILSEDPAGTLPEASSC